MNFDVKLYCETHDRVNVFTQSEARELPSLEGCHCPEPHEEPVDWLLQMLRES